MGGEEAVLHVQERSLGILGDAPRDQGEIAGLLRIAGVDDAPAAIGHAVDVVVAGVDVERLRGQSPGADVENDGQALAGDRVQDLLHQDESLAGSEVGDPAAGDRETLAGGGRAVLGLRLDEGEFLTPEVLLAVGDLGLVAAAHGGGRSDRICAGALRNVGFHPCHHSCSVRRGRYAGEGDPRIPFPKSVHASGV